MDYRSKALMVSWYPTVSIYCKVASIEVQTFYSSRGFTSPRGGKDVEP